MTEPQPQAVTGPDLDEADLRDAWQYLSLEERRQGFLLLPHEQAADFFLALPAHEMSQLLLALPENQRRVWMRLAPPDDAADIVQAAPEGDRGALLSLLDEPTRREVTALMAYAEDAAGGLMHPRFARVRPDSTVDEAMSYLRKQARAQQVGTLAYVYVLGERQHLLGVLSIRQLFVAPGNQLVREIMTTDLVIAHDKDDQEALSKLFTDHDLVAIPVLDEQGHMKGVVTIDDIVEVVQEEATEDIQKFGGMQALDEPYLNVPLATMVRKRAGWLVLLFAGSLLTTAAMAQFQSSLERAMVLLIFVPLIISSGGNSGSQASTLVIRAMALGELRLRDVPRVIRRELAAGLLLGGVLGMLGFLRITIWQAMTHKYGPHWFLLAVSVSIALVGVVLFGTLAGALLPLILRRLGFDPASASAPLVATLVDVSGILIYSGCVTLLLTGSLI
jgi:magnesium transporter